MVDERPDWLIKATSKSKTAKGKRRRAQKSKFRKEFPEVSKRFPGGLL
tara:strand:+ start:541 stop:684 length:144 start_codon:yes stop_codon:yes gene_type:complete